jgi:hypothetical protein
MEGRFNVTLTQHLQQNKMKFSRPESRGQTE